MTDDQLCDLINDHITCWFSFREFFYAQIKSHNSFYWFYRLHAPIENKTQLDITLYYLSQREYILREVLLELSLLHKIDLCLNDVDTNTTRKNIFYNNKMTTVPREPS